jgi:hypothetical protein
MWRRVALPQHTQELVGGFLDQGAMMICFLAHGAKVFKVSKFQGCKVSRLEGSKAFLSTRLRNQSLPPSAVHFETLKP